MKIFQIAVLLLIPLQALAGSSRKKLASKSSSARPVSAAAQLKAEIMADRTEERDEIGSIDPSKPDSERQDLRHKIEQRHFEKRRAIYRRYRKLVRRTKGAGQ